MSERHAADAARIAALETQLAALGAVRSTPRAAPHDKLTVETLAAALDDVLETTAWEGKGTRVAPALLAALLPRLGAVASVSAGRPKEGT